MPLQNVIILFVFLDREMTTLDALYKLFENEAGKYTTFAHIERELHKIDHCKYGDSMTDESLTKEVLEHEEVSA